MKPHICDPVIYTSKIDNGPGYDVVSPAMVIRTRDSTVPLVIDAWGAEPATVVSAADPSVTHQTAGRPAGLVAELPDDTTVDLIVFGLGRTYREYAVPIGNGPGEWSWPPNAAHATFLPDGCDFTLVHCGQPMDVGGSRASWQGTYPDGTQTTENIYGCPRCGATAQITVVDPDQPRPTDTLPRLKAQHPDATRAEGSSGESVASAVRW